MESHEDFYALKAALAWQVELGATEAICEEPVNRFDVPERKKKTAAKTVAAPVQEAPSIDPVTQAISHVGNVKSLEELRVAIESFELCDLKKGARNTVISDGNPAAKIMVIGEAPGRDEDIQGKPFVGRAGQLLDKMFAAIDMGREVEEAGRAVYITNILPWRPPQNRDPEPAEIAMMIPFVEKHVELVAPEIIVLMGNISCQALLGRRGITRLRGNWVNVLGRPALPMFHPAYLLRNPHAKRDAWEDLLALNSKLEGDG